MEFFKCEKCSNRFEDPIECINCHNFFCKRHLEYPNNCPFCKDQSINYCPNIWLIKALKMIEKEERIKKSLMKKCSLCNDFEGEKDSFWIHLMEEHKDKIIEDYTLNANKIEQIITPQKDLKISQLETIETYNVNKSSEMKSKINLNSNIINITNHKKEISKITLDESILLNDTKSLKCNDDMKTKNIKNINLGKKTKKNDIHKEKLIKINFKNTLPQTVKGKIVYCGRKNEIIKCNCCPDHICHKGNCLCVKCMNYNIKNLNLKKNELINKSGLIATYENGKYHCHQLIKNEIKNLNGQESLINKQLCIYNNHSCDECKILNKYIKEYLPKETYIYLKNKNALI